MKWIWIAPAFALTLLLVLFGIVSVVEMWRITAGNWVLPFLVLPLVAGLCAVVCYLVFMLFSEEPNDGISHKKEGGRLQG